jgi:hypothetical protein
MTLLTFVWKVPGSNLGLDAGYPDEAFLSFPQCLETNPWILPRSLLPHLLYFIIG